jgi:dTDP-4-amino-4,6-dideoxygalactose transaminase
MTNLQMVDLKRQYLKIKDEVDQAIQQVIDTTAFINGPQVKQFANALENYLQVKHVIPCANGTDALQIAMMALGLKPGDEVITPSFTYIATVEVVGLLGLKPVFCEVDPKTFTLDPASLEAMITPQTKAIVPVHLYGQAANMDAIMAIAKKHQLFVIEDNAQGIGGYYTGQDGIRRANGTIGDIGSTSFFPSKNLGCYGDGGALYTNDDALAEKIRMVANHGQRQKYVHEMVGCNSRLDTMQAAILLVKLKHLDTYCEARRSVATFYNQAFTDHPNIEIPFEASSAYHVYHQYTVKLNGVNRDQVKKKLEEKGIPSMIYYPIPAHRQKMFEAFDMGNLEMKNTDELTAQVISLPIHTEMHEDELNYIAENFLSIVNELAVQKTEAALNV